MGLPAALPFIKGGIGTLQTLGGLIGMGQERPEREIPAAVRSSLALSKLRVSDPYSPGYNQMRESADLATANALMNAQQAGQTSEAIQTVAAGQQDAYREINQMMETDQDRDEQMLQRSLAEYAREENENYMANELAPYQDRARESRDVFGAGLENIIQGIDDKALMELFS